MKKLKNVVFKLEQGNYWGMIIQNGFGETPDDVHFYLREGEMGIWEFCFSLPWHESVPQSERKFDWSEESVKNAIELFMDNADDEIRIHYM